MSEAFILVAGSHGFTHLSHGEGYKGVLQAKHSTDLSQSTIDAVQVELR